jgi:competence protein ComEA
MRYFVLSSILFFLSAISCFSSEPININSATVQEIESSLPGIGVVKAQAIVAYRKVHGPFTDVEQLLSVKGIGPRTLERIAALVQIDDALGLTPLIDHKRSVEAYDQAVRQAIKRIVSRAEITAQRQTGLQTE